MMFWWIGSLMRPRRREKTRTRELRFVSYAEAERLFAMCDGWRFAPEEDRNRVFGWVHLERVPPEANPGVSDFVRVVDPSDLTPGQLARIAEIVPRGATVDAVYLERARTALHAGSFAVEFLSDYLIRAFKASTRASVDDP